MLEKVACVLEKDTRLATVELKINYTEFVPYGRKNISSPGKHVVSSFPTVFSSFIKNFFGKIPSVQMTSKAAGWR